MSTNDPPTMIAEVDIYRGTYPGVMIIKLYELYSTRRDLFFNRSMSESELLKMYSNTAALLRCMHRQEADVTTSPLSYELRIGVKKCDDPDYAAQLMYEDRMHKLMVDPRVLPEGFREGHYSCSVTLSVGKNFWLRNANDDRILSTVDQAKCRLVLNILQRTGDMGQRPLTLWEHWTSEFRRTFMED
jgi:hypothetical protein